MQTDAGKRKPPQLDAAIRAVQDQVARGGTAELATALNVDPATIGRWASGEMVPRGGNLKRLLAWAESAVPVLVDASGYSAGLMEAARRMSLTVADIIAAAQATAPVAAASPVDSRGAAVAAAAAKARPV